MTPSKETTAAYQLAQSAMAQLKTAVHMALMHGPPDGLRNADIGKLLGIYAGHVGHKGHIPRTILDLMASEGVVQQDSGTKLWRLRPHMAGEDEAEAD